MKKKCRLGFQLVLLFLGAVLPIFSPLAKAEAAEITGVITSMDMKNKSGNEITRGLDIWQDFRVYAKFALPDNQVQQGDTTTITLPPELAFANSAPIELRDADQQVVANGRLNSADKTLTLTYTDYAEQKSGIQGEFFFYARVDHNVVTEEGDINAEFTVGGQTISAGTVHYNGPPKKYDSKIEKSSYQAAADGKNEIRYNIAINRNMESYSDVTVTDKILSPNFQVDIESIRVYKVAWRWNNGSWARDTTENVTADFKSKIVSDAAGDGFTLNLGNMDQFGYLLEYKIKANYDLVDGEQVSNRADLSYNGNLSDSSTGVRSYQIAGGLAEGYVFSIKVHKTNEEGENLAGAEFEVVRDRTGAVVGKVTTDGDGNASVGQLLRDNYTLREVKAPDGYDLSTEEIKINPQDFDADRAVTREVVNKRTPVAPKVTFSKVNLGGQEIAGAQIQIFQGDKTEGTAAASWTSEAGQSKEFDLAPGIYTFHEEAAPSGYLKVTDITFQVKQDGTVEVTNVGEKDAKGEDNKVVANGATLTVTDKDDDLPRKAIFSNVNVAGTEIAGAGIQIFRGEQASGNPVDTWVSEANAAHELELTSGVYTFHEKAAPTGYLAVTDIVFQVNLDGSMTVLNNNGNTVEFKDGKLVVTHQTAPTDPNQNQTTDPSQDTTRDPKDPASQDANKSGDRDDADPGKMSNQTGGRKKVLPSTGTELGLGLCALGIVLLSGCCVYFKIHLKK